MNASPTPKRLMTCVSNDWAACRVSSYASAPSAPMLTTSRGTPNPRLISSASRSGSVGVSKTALASDGLMKSTSTLGRISSKNGRASSTRHNWYRKFKSKITRRPFALARSTAHFTTRRQFSPSAGVIPLT